MRILAGIRPTGSLHIGHYFGFVKNILRYQNDPNYEVFLMIADLHALTNGCVITNTDIHFTVVDLINAGVDPEKVCIFQQSQVPAISELAVVLSMVTPVKWLQTCPTIKVQDPTTLKVGALNYPLLQAADIISLEAVKVLVGSDQLPHIELTRKIAKTLNHSLDHNPPIFNLPTGEVQPCVSGLDGSKMSKSLNNTIPLASSNSDILERILRAVSDPGRPSASSPGDTSRCVGVYPLYKEVAPEMVSEVQQTCESGVRRCHDCKRELADKTIDLVNWIMAENLKLNDTEVTQNLLTVGSKKVQDNASLVLNRVKVAFGISTV